MKRRVHAVKLTMTIVLLAFLFLSVRNLGYVHAADKEIVLLKLASKENYDTIQAAIDAITAREDAIVQVPAGTYSEPLKISNTSSWTVIPKGASVDVSAYSNNGVRSGEEAILTDGIEVDGLSEDDSLEASGLIMYGKGINIVGWGTPIKPSGSVRIVNNVIINIIDKSIFAIHINCGSDKYIDTVELKNNYIDNIGEEGYAASGVYSTLLAHVMYISGNYIGNVNHTATQLGDTTVKELLSITEGHILNQDRDGITGTGTQGS